MKAVVGGGSQRSSTQLITENPKKATHVIIAILRSLERKVSFCFLFDKWIIAKLKNRAAKGKLRMQ